MDVRALVGEFGLDYVPAGVAAEPVPHAISSTDFSAKRFGSQLSISRRSACCSGWD